MPGNNVVPDRLRIHLYQCTACQFTHQHKHSVRYHQSKNATCANTGIAGFNVMMMPATDGANEQSAPVALFGADVVPIGSAQEREAAVRHLVDTPGLMRNVVLACSRATRVPMLVFEHTRGPRGPEHLRNVRVFGGRAHVKTTGGVAMMPLRRYAVQTLAWALDVVSEAIEALDDAASADQVLRARMDHACHVLFDAEFTCKAGRTFTRASAASVYEQDNAIFHAQVTGRVKNDTVAAAGEMMAAVMKPA